MGSKTDLVRFLNNLRPKVDHVLIGQFNLKPDQFFRFHLAAGKDEATGLTEAGDGGCLLAKHSFPAYWKLYFDPWTGSLLVLQKIIQLKLLARIIHEKAQPTFHELL